MVADPRTLVLDLNSNIGLIGDIGVTASSIQTALGYYPMDPGNFTYANLGSKPNTISGIGSITVSADTLIYATSSSSFATTAFTSVARTLLAQPTQSLLRSTGLGMSVDGAALVAGTNAAMKTQLGLDNIDNTADANKPVSTATQNALNNKANDSVVVHNTGNETVAGNKTFSGVTTFNGDITVNGTTTTLNAANLDVSDAIIRVATGNTSDLVSYAGLKVERGTTDSFLVWDKTAVAWVAYTSADDLTTPVAAAFSGSQLKSTVATGTAPFVVASTTLVTNLNAQLLGGQLGSYYLDPNNLSASIPASKMPALTGDVTTSAGTVATTLATVNSNTGSFGSGTQSVSLTLDGKGRVIAAAANTIAPPWSAIASKPTTLAGFGISDGQPLNSMLTGLTGVAWSAGSQVPTLTAANTFTLLTVGATNPTDLVDKQSADARYLLQSNFTYANLGSKPTTLAGYGITNGQVLSSNLTSLAASNWSAGTQAPVLTASNTYSLLNVGAASATDLIDRQSGDARYLLQSNFTFANLGSKPTTVAGFGITDAQAKATILTDISALTYASNTLKVIQLNAGGTGFQWAALTSGFSNFTEALNTSAPNATINAVQMSIVNGNTDADMVLTPKGLGALILSIPTSTTLGGNKRGSNAVDLQFGRGNATHVASGLNSVLIGGVNNKATFDYSGVFAGSTNVASSTGCVVVGGSSNIAQTGSSSAVIGGSGNTVSSNSGFIGGGSSNTVNGNQGAIIGGNTNRADATNSTTIGGLNNNNAVNSAVVMGERGMSHLKNQFAIGNGNNTVGVSSTWSKIMLRAETVDATVTTLTSDGAAVSTSGATQNILASSTTSDTFGFKGRVFAKVTGQSTLTNYAIWDIEGIYHRTSTTNTLLSSTVTAVSNTPAWTLTNNATTNGLEIKFTGAAATNINIIGHLDVLWRTG